MMQYILIFSGITLVFGILIFLAVVQVKVTEVVITVITVIGRFGFEVVVFHVEIVTFVFGVQVEFTVEFAFRFFNRRQAHRTRRQGCSVVDDVSTAGIRRTHDVFNTNGLVSRQGSVRFLQEHLDGAGFGCRSANDAVAV